MEGMLRFVQDLVALTFAVIAVGLGVYIAMGRIRFMRHTLLRILASPVCIVFGLWIFYMGIRHVVAT